MSTLSDHLHLVFVQPSGEQGGLIHQVFQISSGKARGAAGNHAEVHIRGQRRLPHMNFKYALSAPYIWQGNHYLTVEAAWTQ